MDEPFIKKWQTSSRFERLLLPNVCAFHIQHSAPLPPEEARTRSRESSSCSCLSILPGPAWLLINKICISFACSLYKRGRELKGEQGNRMSEPRSCTSLVSTLDLIPKGGREGGRKEGRREGRKECRRESVTELIRRGNHFRQYKQ